MLHRFYSVAARTSSWLQVPIRAHVRGARALRVRDMQSLSVVLNHRAFISIQSCTAFCEFSYCLFAFEFTNVKNVEIFLYMNRMHFCIFIFVIFVKSNIELKMHEKIEKARNCAYFDSTSRHCTTVWSKKQCFKLIFLTRQGNRSGTHGCNSVKRFKWI